MAYAEKLSKLKFFKAWAYDSFKSSSNMTIQLCVWAMSVLVLTFTMFYVFLPIWAV